MSKWRKKPVVIEAVLVQDILDFDRETPSWVEYAIANGEVKVYQECIIVRTVEGNMRGELSDMLIKGTQNELYPCKPQAFADTFEAVTE